MALPQDTPDYVGPRANEKVIFQLVSTVRGETASVTIRDIVTDEILGMVVTDVSPFDDIRDVFRDLYDVVPTQLPLV